MPYSSGFASINAKRATTAQLVDTTGQGYFADAHPYLEERLEQLIREIPELTGLEPGPLSRKRCSATRLRSAHQRVCASSGPKVGLLHANALLA